MRSRLTIPTRVFLAFALVLTLASTVSVASILQHQRMAANLRLLHEGYLPLALTIGEVRATQAVFGTLLDRLLSERDPTATRSWLNTARRVRPVTIRRALDRIARVEQLAPPEDHRLVLARLREQLERVQASYAADDTRFDALFSALEAGDEARAERLLPELRKREQAIAKHLGTAWNVIQDQIQATGESVSERERQSVVVLAVLALVTLGVGIAVTWWSQRVLAPLPRLQARVEAVARGDLVRRLGPTTDDEIGRLAREFERMVAALAARDERLKEATAQLVQSERLAAVGRMAAHVTHEVRNPLNSIHLNVELLEDEVADGRAEEARALLQAVKREIERLTGITEEYLRMARLPRPQLEPEDLGALAQSVVDFLEPELASAGVRVELDVEPDLPFVAVDEGQIRQALLNVLRNACQAMPEGGRVDLEVARHENGVAVRVSDEGSGIEPEQREKIFDLFYTTKDLGSGLGLPLCQQIMVAHGGRIECRSEVGQGTTFELWFPLADSLRAGGARAASGFPPANHTSPEGSE